ncbi:MAG: redoxin domain-containing protein [Planctomycetaceae bacterium]
MQRRTLVLPFAAVVITALCVYATVRPYPPQRRIRGPQEMRPAPLFELYDKQNRTVRLKAYVGRHRILVVFFDGEGGADRDPLLRRLRGDFENLESDVKILAVSTALPQHNRQADPFPFPLLSDPGLQVHRQWGRYDEQTERPLTGVFHIDRAGLVAWSDGHPQPLSDPNDQINRLLDD